MTKPDMYAVFLASLGAAAPLSGFDARVLALWRGLNGDWAGAHELVQELPDREAAWVHAWLHRVEGDLGNAGYWYRRAGRAVSTASHEAEGKAIAAVLLG